MSLRGESHRASRYYLPKHQLRQECRRRTCNQNDTVVEKCLCFARIAEPIEERKHYHRAVLPPHQRGDTNQQTEQGEIAPTSNGPGVLASSRGRSSSMRTTSHEACLLRPPCTIQRNDAATDVTRLSAASPRGTNALTVRRSQTSASEAKK